MRTALAASAIGYGVVAVLILCRIGGRLNEAPAALTSPTVPEVATVP